MSGLSAYTTDAQRAHLVAAIRADLARVERERHRLMARPVRRVVSARVTAAQMRAELIRAELAEMGERA